MSQCLRITFLYKTDRNLVHTIVQEQARSLALEGTAHVLPDKMIKIIACGPKNAMDAFVDVLHTEMIRETIQDLEIEPSIKEKDFRGVFRVIE